MGARRTMVRRARLGVTAAAVAVVATGCLSWDAPVTTPVDGFPLGTLAAGRVHEGRLFGGDIDGDGYGDVLGYAHDYAAGGSGRQGFILFSDGDGTFTQQDLPPGRWPTVVGDLDGDGVDDVVIGGVGGVSSRTIFFGGPADGTRPRGLSDSDTVALPNSRGDIDGVGDYDGDGHLDVLLMQNEDLYYERWTPYLNDGTAASFTADPALSVLSGPINAGLNRYTQIRLDGRDHLFANGMFGMGVPWAQPGLTVRAWGDIDGDGNDDLAATVDGELRFYQLTLDTFEPFVDYQDIMVTGTPFVDLLDLDGDGVTDLAYSDGAGANYLTGTADGGFPYEQVGGGPVGRAVFVDVDGDGLVDAVTATSDGGSIVVHRNASGD